MAVTYIVYYCLLPSYKENYMATSISFASSEFHGRISGNLDSNVAAGETVQLEVCGAVFPTVIVSMGAVQWSVSNVFTVTPLSGTFSCTPGQTYSATVRVVDSGGNPTGVSQTSDIVVWKNRVQNPTEGSTSNFYTIPTTLPVTTQYVLGAGETIECVVNGATFRNSTLTFSNNYNIDISGTPYSGSLLPLEYEQVYPVSVRVIDESGNPLGTIANYNIKSIIDLSSITSKTYRMGYPGQIGGSFPSGAESLNATYTVTVGGATYIPTLYSISSTYYWKVELGTDTPTSGTLNLVLGNNIITVEGTKSGVTAQKTGPLSMIEDTTKLYTLSVANIPSPGCGLIEGVICTDAVAGQQVTPNSVDLTRCYFKFINISSQEVTMIPTTMSVGMMGGSTLSVVGNEIQFNSLNSMTDCTFSDGVNPIKFAYFTVGQGKIHTNNRSSSAVPVATPLVVAVGAIVPEEVSVVGGKVVGEVSVDPTVDEVTYNGQALPTGSVVRNTITSQKFVKIDGDSTSFKAIEVTPKVEWEFSTAGDEAWEYFNNL